MTGGTLKQLDDIELRAEHDVWANACTRSRSLRLIALADRERNRIIAEGWRRDRDFWRREATR